MIYCKCHFISPIICICKMIFKCLHWKIWISYLIFLSCFLVQISKHFWIKFTWEAKWLKNVSMYCFCFKQKKKYLPISSEDKFKEITRLFVLLHWQWFLISSKNSLNFNKKIQKAKLYIFLSHFASQVNVFWFMNV